MPLQDLRAASRDLYRHWGIYLRYKQPALFYNKFETETQKLKLSIWVLYLQIALPFSL